MMTHSAQGPGKAMQTQEQHSWSMSMPLILQIAALLSYPNTGLLCTSLGYPGRDPGSDVTAPASQLQAEADSSGSSQDAALYVAKLAFKTKSHP